MNLIPVIRESLGLQEDEEFRLNDINGGTYTSEYRFTNDDFQVREIQGWNDADSLILKLILIGKREVVKLPFKPEEREPYYYVGLYNGEIFSISYSRGYAQDEMRIKSGNCYRTYEEAEKHVDEWMSKIYGENWKELLK